MAAHWRDGGIGNMPGSDDRPIEEWTLLEKLDEIVSTLKGWQLPKCLGVAGPNTDWGTPLSKIASEAFDEIQRLRGGYPADLSDFVTKLRMIAAEDIGDGLASTPVELLREAANAIERLRDQDWQPIDTAPVPDFALADHCQPSGVPEVLETAANAESSAVMGEPESWRRTDLEEWGNSAVTQGKDLEHILWTLHYDAAKTLPPSTRYDMRVINRNGQIAWCQIAWYSHSLMIDDPTWGGGFGWRDGCYLIGQYLTPKPAENAENGGAA